MLFNVDATHYRDSRLNKIVKDDFKHSLLTVGYFAEANILPPIYTILRRSGRNDTTIRSPLIVHVSKAKNEWRDFTFLHPENYGQLVSQITDNLDEIKDHLSGTKTVVSYSPPLTFNDQSERAGFQVTGWLNLQEHLVQASALHRLNTLVQIDIQRCYHVLYTHTLEWALKDMGDGNLGEKLDKAIRRGNNNRTHGIPVGPYASDIAAEIILTAIDKKIEEASNNIEFLGFRYKDNYYMLCKSVNDAEKLISKTAIQLRDYHLTINDSKTVVQDFTDFLINKWQVEHDLLGESIGISSKKLTNKQLQVYLAKSILISKKHNNQRNVIEKSITKILECELVGPIDWHWLFYTLSSALDLKTISYPKIIAYMKKIAFEQGHWIGREYKVFLQAEIEYSRQNGNIYHLIWLAYIIKDYTSEDVRTQITEALEEFSGNTFVAKMIEFMEDRLTDLWGEHQGEVKFIPANYMPHDMLLDHLALSFSES